jgi:hypothetical protein
MAEVADLLEKAVGEILIVCDYPAFGFFSNPTDWLRYRHAIERRLQSGVSVSMTVFDDWTFDIVKRAQL